MGVAGSGKSTVAQAFAYQKGWPFVEADEFHPPSNVEKMATGRALVDADRQGWIVSIGRHLARLKSDVVVLACSALTLQVQTWLGEATEREIVWCLLDIDEESARRRVEGRPDHFMPTSLVRSQFDALQRPHDAWQIDASRSLAAILKDLEAHLDGQVEG